jgi:hypothetical protein
MNPINTLAMLAASALTGGLITGAYTLGQQSVPARDITPHHAKHQPPHGQHHHKQQGVRTP